MKPNTDSHYVKVYGPVEYISQSLKLNKTQNRCAQSESICYVATSLVTVFKTLLLTIGLTWQKYIPASLKGMMEEDTKQN